MASLTVCHGDDGAASRAVPHGFHLHDGQGDLQVLDDRVQALTVVCDPVSKQARREVAREPRRRISPTTSLTPRQIAATSSSG